MSADVDRVRWWDLDGWKQIGKALGVSERTARRMAASENLPVRHVRGRVKARRSDLRLWLGQRTTDS